MRAGKRAWAVIGAVISVMIVGLSVVGVVVSLV
jgi:hypothetical protein